MNVLIAKLRSQREAWVTLDEAAGLKVRLIRPAEAEMATLRDSAAFDIAAKFATGWEGFTEARLLGAAVGADEPVEFFPELWTEVVRDNAAWAVVCVDHILAELDRHSAAKADVAKN